MLIDADARDLAIFVDFELSPADEELLAPLVDATLVWADEETLAGISVPIVEAMWADELREDIENVLVELAKTHTRVRGLLDVARLDLDLGPRESVLARAVVEQMAVQRAGEEQLPVCCLLCLEEEIHRAPEEERAGRAVRLGRIARRAAAVPVEEVRAAVAAAARAKAGVEGVAERLATDERRLAVRAWLGHLADLGATSLPATAAALDELLDEMLPPVDADDVWRETCIGLMSGLGSVRPRAAGTSIRGTFG